eukprot:2626220-Amphidinium_carterae.1
MKTPARAVAFRTAAVSEGCDSSSLPRGVTIEGDSHNQRLVCMCGRSRALRWRKQFVREHANCGAKPLTLEEAQARYTVPEGFRICVRH